MLKFEEELKDNLVTYIFLSLLSNFVQFYFPGNFLQTNDPFSPFKIMLSYVLCS